VLLAVADLVPLGKRAHVASSDFKSYGPKLALSGAVYDLGNHYRDQEKPERVGPFQDPSFDAHRGLVGRIAAAF